MTLDYAEAAARLTAPGAPFETEEIEVGGHPVTAFVGVPSSMRELFASARGRGDATFLVYEDERWSFEETMAKVDAMAALLVEGHGVAKGDRVAIAMRNYPEWVVTFAAALSIGAISVSLNAWWTEDELDFALEDCGAKVLVADVERIERGAESCKRLDIAVVAVRTPVGATLPEGLRIERWEDVPLGAPMPDVTVLPDDDATILYTSGTTGRPKGAVSTHRALLQALKGFGCRTAIERLRRPEDAESAAKDAPCFILVVPLFHVTGCVPVMLSCFSAGLKLVIMHKWEPLRALQLIERERVTNFVGVPTQSWDLLECPEFSSFDTSSLQAVGGGGAPAPPELVKRVAGSFKAGKPSIGYGMTETNAYGPGNTGIDYVEHPTSTGRGTPIMRIAIRDELGQEVPTGERGEIWFGGPHLIRGYWNRPDATAETIVDGWLRTGDLGRMDPDGFLYIEDRAKDMILRAGENVYSAEVEAALYEHPGVYECAVFGVPHERLGEEVAAAIVPRDGVTLDVDELRSHVAARLAGFKVPTVVRFFDEPLPRNAAGKILKRQLRDDLASS